MSKTITLCSSASFYRKVLEIAKYLRRLGYKVKLPGSARLMQRNNDFDVSHYKTWFNDKNTYKLKTKLMKDHFKKVIEGDAILVVNLEKHGIQGYIGGNVLMEMTLAFHFKKPIFIYQDISKSNYEEEILGMNPLFINEDLSRIKL